MQISVFDAIIMRYDFFFYMKMSLVPDAAYKRASVSVYFPATSY